MQALFIPKINFPLIPQKIIQEDPEFAFWDEFNHLREQTQEEIFSKFSLYQPVKSKQQVN